MNYENLKFTATIEPNILRIASNVNYLPGNIIAAVLSERNYEESKKYQIEIIFEVTNRVKTKVKKYNLNSSLSFYNWYYIEKENELVYFAHRFGYLIAIIKNLSTSRVYVRVNPFYYNLFLNGITRLGRTLSPSKILQDIMILKLIEKGVIPIHCSGVSDGNFAYLFFAPPNTGKSYTVYKLVKREEKLKFISDDIAFLSNGGRVYPNLNALTLDIDVWNYITGLLKKLHLRIFVYLMYKTPLKYIPLPLYPPKVDVPSLIKEIYSNKIAEGREKVKAIFLLHKKKAKQCVKEIEDKEIALKKLLLLNSAELDIDNSPLLNAYSYFIDEGYREMIIRIYKDVLKKELCDRKYGIKVFEIVGIKSDDYYEIAKDIIQKLWRE